MSYSELFWSSFSCIPAEYGEIRSISPYSVRMRENADQNKSEFGYLSRSEVSCSELILEGTFRKWDYFWLNGLNFKDQKKKNLLFSQKRIFLNKAAWVCVNMRKYIMSQVFIAWYNNFIKLYNHGGYDSLKANIVKKLNDM